MEGEVCVCGGGGVSGNENKTRMSRDLRQRKQDEGLLERRRGGTEGCCE